MTDFQQSGGLVRHLPNLLSAARLRNVLGHRRDRHPAQCLAHQDARAASSPCLAGLPAHDGDAQPGVSQTLRVRTGGTRRRGTEELGNLTATSAVNRARGLAFVAGDGEASGLVHQAIVGDIFRTTHLC